MGNGNAQSVRSWDEGDGPAVPGGSQKRQKGYRVPLVYSYDKFVERKGYSEEEIGNMPHDVLYRRWVEYQLEAQYGIPG